MTEENRNALMQRNDRLIRDVIQKAEKECKSAVALIAMYGSFCTGRYSETSDLDLFVLMRNEDGYKACVTFILDEIGENLDMPAFDLLEKFDAEDLSAAAAQFDGALSLYAKEYEKAGLKPNVFDSIEAFEKMYLG